MQFTSTLFTLAVVASQVAANSVLFVNQDEITRTVYFTPQEGQDPVGEITVDGNGSQNVTFSDGWIGNFYAIQEGAENTAGMLGEVSFSGWGDAAAYFDISAIVDPNDNSNIKELYPASSKSPVSGCQTFPCDNAYNKWDDVETQATSETNLVCLMGTSSSSSRKRAGAVLPVRNLAPSTSVKVGREFVTTRQSPPQ